MISSYKGAVLAIWKILSEAQAEASNHSNAEIRAEILNGAICRAIEIKRQYFGPYSKPSRYDEGEWFDPLEKAREQGLLPKDTDIIYYDTDSVKIKEDNT